jgi:hypothetical protein
VSWILRSLLCRRRGNNVSCVPVYETCDRLLLFMSSNGIIYILSAFIRPLRAVLSSHIFLRCVHLISSSAILQPSNIEAMTYDTEMAGLIPAKGHLTMALIGYLRFLGRFVTEDLLCVNRKSCYLCADCVKASYSINLLKYVPTYTCIGLLDCSRYRVCVRSEKTTK